MENLNEAIQTFKEKRILVIGDIMLDRWTFGRTYRVSPEAPVPIVEKISESVTLGGAANVANNLASLGAKVYLAGIVGSDHRKDRIYKLLDEKGISREAILVHPTRQTTEKNRILSSDNHHVLRLDSETTGELTPAEEEELFSLFAPLIPTSDAIVLSEYMKGVFSLRFAQKIIAEAKKHHKIVLADVRPPTKHYFKGVDVIKPNLKEGREMTGLQAPTEIGRALVKEYNAYVLLTLGGDGMSVFNSDNAEEYRIPGKKITVFDVSGAGDTAIAVLALALSSGLSIKTAAWLSNEACGIVVQKSGTATLSIEELASSLHLVGSHVDDMSIVSKVWGYEKWLENNEKYCCKILSVNKGYQCSLHYHKNKDETFVVTAGHIRLELGDQIIHLRAGSYVRVLPGTPHRFTGMEDSLIMEVSTHHEDSDSYRIEESRAVDLAQFR
jgi:rfaE bifunctional protein kinase chain/domain